MTVTKKQAQAALDKMALAYGTQLYCKPLQDLIDAMPDYIESIDSDTSIRAELRRAAMDQSIALSREADSQPNIFTEFHEYLCDLTNEQYSWFLLMVAECL